MSQKQPNPPPTGERPSPPPAPPKADTASPGSAVVEFRVTEAALAELRQRYERAVFDVKTTTGMKAAKAARAELRDLRVALEAKREALKKPILERGRELDSEAKRITADLVALEEPIDGQIKAEEERREKAREEAERVERERLGRIAARIEAIRGAVVQAATLTKAQAFREVIGQVEAFPMTEELYGERLEEAQEARLGVLAVLSRMLDAAVERERADEDLRKQREELERRAEEQRREEADRQAKARVEAERVRAEEEERQRRIQAEEAERQARIHAEEEERQRRLRAEDQERERLRAEEERVREAEAARVRGIRERISQLALAGVQFGALATSISIEARAEELADEELAPGEFGEFLAEAMRVRNESVEALRRAAADLREEEARIARLREAEAAAAEATRALVKEADPVGALDAIAAALDLGEMPAARLKRIRRIVEAWRKACEELEELANPSSAVEDFAE